jgi:hypothetical protein
MDLKEIEWNIVDVIRVAQGQVVGYNMLRISWVSEQLLDSQDWLSCMQLVRL